MHARVLIIFFLICGRGFSQTDSLRKSAYQFHLSHKGQEGYGITAGYKTDMSNDKGGYRNIYVIGLAKSTQNTNHMGQQFDYKMLWLEINPIKNDTYYGFAAGVDTKSFIIDLGIDIGYSTNFSNGQAVFIRPRVGFTFCEWLNLDAIMEYNIYPYYRKFEIRNNWIGGFRYSIGVLKHR
jgi:hypothetical protein